MSYINVYGVRQMSNDFCYCQLNVTGVPVTLNCNCNCNCLFNVTDSLVTLNR